VLIEAEVDSQLCTFSTLLNRFASRCPSCST
jgi:hypothetical protein